MTQAAATTLSPCGHSGEGEASLVQPQHDPNSRSSREPPAVSRPPGSVRQLLQGVEKPCPAPTPLSAASCSQPHAHMHSHCAHTCTPAGPAPLHPVPAQDCGGAGGAGLRTGSPGIPDSCCPPAVKPDVRHVGGSRQAHQVPPPDLPPPPPPALPSVGLTWRIPALPSEGLTWRIPENSEPRGVSPSQGTDTQSSLAAAAAPSGVLHALLCVVSTLLKKKNTRKCNCP